MIDRRLDPKSDMGNFELAYRQVVPPTPAYMGLNLFVKGKQLLHKVNHGHGHYYYQQQRKERSLATSSVFRQRSAIIPATTMSRIHRAMPTFNATEYMEKYMVEPLSSSRSSISSTQQQQQQSATTTTFNTLKSPTVGSIANQHSSPCPYLLKQAGRSISQLLSATQKRNTTSNNASGGMELNMNASLPPKRQRSCGPRFATNQVESTEKKFKILIKNYASNTAANLLEKQEPVPSAPATAPVISERKWRSLRNINGTTTSSTTTATLTSTCSRSKQMTTSSLLESSHCSRRFARTKSEIESSASMHAIGRTFGRKSNGPRLPISISVQALHRGEPILSAMKQATSELQLSQSQIVSPRTALANKLNNSTLTVPLPTC